MTVCFQRHRILSLCCMLLLGWGGFTATAPAAEPAAATDVLFLGDDGPHQPASRAELLRAALATHGIAVTYSRNPDDLNNDTLGKYACLLIYANIDEITAPQEQALLEYVESGHGLVVVHCGAYCFRNSPRYVKLVGGQFKSHGSGVFRSRIIDAQHPAMQDVTSFESWDESYVHHQFADDLRVLMVRDHEGGYEPYTWVRQQGKGRVYYTALGHDVRTWRNPAFHRQLQQAIRWSVGELNEPPRPAVAGPVSAVPTGPQTGNTPDPLAPEESIRRMHLPEGLRVELFAAEPLIRNPLAMAFDERGRLWVLESPDYPNNVLPRSIGNDSVRILEDTDGDGRADKVKVFAEGLNIPTAICFGGGGVIVGNTPDILLLKDTDGDDVADERHVLYTGFQRGDTHFEMNNFCYGLDNWIYGALGAAGANVEAGGKRSTLSRGFFRFRPDGSAFEALTTTSNNTYGLGLTAAGDVLGSTANFDHSWYMAIPNRHFERVQGWHGTGGGFNADHRLSHPLVRPPRQWDFAGTYTAACSTSVYAARQMPAEYQDRAMFVCEPTINLIHMNLLQQEGSHLVSRDGWNLMASDDPWCGPVSVMLGPDGAIWFLDMYSFTMLHSKPDEPIENHGKGYAWKTAIRDTERARVYRIVWNGAKPEELKSLDRSDTGTLLAALGHDNLFWRIMAQRLLVERGQQDVVPALLGMADDTSKPQAQLHALRVLQGLGATAQPTDAVAATLARALVNAVPAVQRAVLDMLPRQAQSVDLIVKLPDGPLFSEDAFVRRDALLALSEMPGSAAAARAIVQVLGEERNATDRWIPLAATSAAAASAPQFLQAAVAVPAEQQPTQALLEAVRAVANHYARGQAGDGAVQLIVRLQKTPPLVASALLDGLIDGWQAGTEPTLEAADRDQLHAALLALSPDNQTRLLTLSSRWGRTDLFREQRKAIEQQLLAAVADHARNVPDRIEAASNLIKLSDGAESVEGLVENITPQAPPEFVEKLLDVLATSEQAGTASVLLEAWTSLTPSLQNKVVDVLLSRADWTGTLLDRVEAGDLSSQDLTPSHQQRLAGHPDGRLAERARKLIESGGGGIDPDRQSVLNKLLPLAEHSGDAALGRAVFEKNCAVCHSHNGKGGKVGPDLTGVAAREKTELLIDILDPSRSVEFNYRLWLLQTTSGLSLAGRLDSETQTAVELLDATGKRHVIPRDEIEQLQSRPQSVMPTGFEKLSEAELVNLLEFLRSRGQFVPLPLASVATACSSRPMFQEGELDRERLLLDDWSPRTIAGAPFQLTSPAGERKNVVVLHGPQGAVSATMPRTVKVPYAGPARAVHLLSGVSGWGFPATRDASVSMIVRLHYADGKTEDHPLVNGMHFADYCFRTDVPESRFAFSLSGGQQMRYLAVVPQRTENLSAIELVKGPDGTAPVVLAVTIETPPTQ